MLISEIKDKALRELAQKRYSQHLKTTGSNHQENPTLNYFPWHKTKEKYKFWNKVNMGIITSLPKKKKSLKKISKKLDDIYLIINQNKNKIDLLMGKSKGNNQILTDLKKDVYILTSLFSENIKDIDNEESPINMPTQSIEDYEGKPEYPNQEYQELFDHMHIEHNLILLQSEMDSIISICGNFNKKPKFTIQDLSDGKCAVINDGSLDELKNVLSKAFPECGKVQGAATYYQAVKEDNSLWEAIDHTELSTQSVKDFL